MQATEARAEVFLTAFRSLTKKEREQILTKLLEDPILREDLLDMATYESRKDEPTRPFRDYLAEKTERESDALHRKHDKRS